MNNPNLSLALTLARKLAREVAELAAMGYRTTPAEHDILLLAMALERFDVDVTEGKV